MTQRADSTSVRRASITGMGYETGAWDALSQSEKVTHLEAIIGFDD